MFKFLIKSKTYKLFQHLQSQSAAHKIIQISVAMANAAKKALTAKAIFAKITVAPPLSASDKTAKSGAPAMPAASETEFRHKHCLSVFESEVSATIDQTTPMISASMPAPKNVHVRAVTAGIAKK